jgi:oligopeptide transport system substrate-binding protein
MGSSESYVCNGPFRPKSGHPSRGYELVKNAYYWDREVVKIDRISVTKNDSVDANELFKKDEMDWLGRPLRPWEGYFNVAPEDHSDAAPLGTIWCVFNVQRYPFHHLKLRQAFAYAVDRTRLEKACPAAAPAATTALPLSHTQNYDASLIEGDPELALRLFEEALRELGISREDFPVITLIHSGGETRDQVAEFLKESFQDIFNIPIRTESYEFHTLFNKMIRGEYQLAIILWQSWVNDPIYTLNAFSDRANKVNFSKWEHPAFQKLLEQAQSETDLSKRLTLLKEAEKILMLETPVLPLFYELNRYVYKKHLRDVVLTDSGNIDFKWASIVRNPLQP